MISIDRPKGMRLAVWEQVKADAIRAALPQYYIIWSYRGQALQWARGPDYQSGVMKGRRLTRDGLSLFIWHAAVVDSMQWAYHPYQDPPKGWRKATPEDLLNIEPDHD